MLKPAWLLGFNQWPRIYVVKQTQEIPFTYPIKMSVQSVVGIVDSSSTATYGYVVTSKYAYTYDYNTKTPTIRLSGTFNADNVIHVMAIGYTSTN